MTQDSLHTVQVILRAIRQYRKTKATLAALVNKGNPNDPRGRFLDNQAARAEFDSATRHLAQLTDKNFEHLMALDTEEDNP